MIFATVQFLIITALVLLSLWITLRNYFPEACDSLLENLRRACLRHRHIRGMAWLIKRLEQDKTRVSVNCGSCKSCTACAPSAHSELYEPDVIRFVDLDVQK
ncbi:DUF6587 family protein [Zhongshania sp. BJYM1]|uniref:DUF6587 family protein n=1 Tax=Zhongshania aquatica TaxID=2965069 RepID=UPI0022B4C15D|nr:DUF6587 family protein [Marortus sp. BJYM1]